MSADTWSLLEYIRRDILDIVVARHPEGDNMRNRYGCEVQLDLRAIQVSICGLLHRDGLGIANIVHRDLLKISASDSAV